MKRKFKKAFTITELVIVIAVIAVLAAVLIPTFSNVIDKSKKSHDIQYVKEMNVALNNYTIENGGKAPKDYEELMLALSDAGLTDNSNPFLLATKLKQKDAVILWYPNTNYLTLINTEAGEYTLIFESTLGLGNGVQVVVNGQSGDESGYILCSTGSKDGEFVAKAYYEFYEKCGGDISKFAQVQAYSTEKIIASMENKSWANSIVSAISNHEVGYTYSTSIATKITDNLKNAEYTTISCLPTNDPAVTVESKWENLNDNQKKVVSQSVRNTLATISNIANDGQTSDKFAKKTITLELPKDTVVDMKGTIFNPIGKTYRKSSELVTGSASTTLSLDFGGLTIENMTVKENEFVSSGAEYQSQSDNSFKGGAYAFTYGLFGTVIAKPGETVTISNLNINGVNMNLFGKQKTVDGSMVNTISDMAGIVAGYTQGNVVFKNIQIDGKINGEQGKYIGFDGVSGLVGRCYGAVNNNKTIESKVLIDDCHISNVDITGQRRASGFVAFASNKCHVEIKNSSLDNVNVLCQRSDSVHQAYGTILGDIAHSARALLTGENITLNKVTCRFVCDAVFDSDKPGTSEVDAAIAQYLKIKSQDYTYLLIRSNKNSADFILKNVKIGEQTYEEIKF